MFSRKKLLLILICAFPIIGNSSQEIFLEEFKKPYTSRFNTVYNHDFPTVAEALENSKTLATQAALDACEAAKTGDKSLKCIHKLKEERNIRTNRGYELGGFSGKTEGSIKYIAVFWLVREVFTLGDDNVFNAETGVCNYIPPKYTSIPSIKYKNISRHQTFSNATPSDWEAHNTELQVGRRNPDIYCTGKGFDSSIDLQEIPVSGNGRDVSGYMQIFITCKKTERVPLKEETIVSISGDPSQMKVEKCNRLLICENGLVNGDFPSEKLDIITKLQNKYKCLD